MIKVQLKSKVDCPKSVREIPVGHAFRLHSDMFINRFYKYTDNNFMREDGQIFVVDDFSNGHNYRDLGKAVVTLSEKGIVFTFDKEIERKLASEIPIGHAFRFSEKGPSWYKLSGIYAINTDDDSVGVLPIISFKTRDWYDLGSATLTVDF
jgi:hypothetical protein